jgi:transposase
MTLTPRPEMAIPEMTARAARRAFPKGNPYITLRDELGELYADETFASLFSWKGEEAQSPGMLALVCVMQYMEGLSDRQAAEAVRARLDWKYALGLELDDAGFDASLLTRFRQRLLEGEAEAAILDTILGVAVEKKLLKKRGRQRTDATHVLGAVRDLSRLELVGETVRQALEVLAVAVPEWLRAQADPAWFERYGRRWELYRLPEGKEAQAELALAVGADGYRLLTALYGEAELTALWTHPAVEALRQIWIQQYYRENDQVYWRQAGNLPPGAVMLNSPYDLEVRYGVKRQTTWKGYKVHVTETCDADTPHLVVAVTTTLATTPDYQMLDPIHQELAAKDLLPAEQTVDAGYVDAGNLVSSQVDHQVRVVGPVTPDTSWQAREQSGYDVATFWVDWEAQQVTCPQGQTSRTWSPGVDGTGNPVIHVRFAAQDCLACPARHQCTRAVKGARSLCIRPQAEHEALQRARREQQGEAFRQRYKVRAGVEGTLSQAIRTQGLRRSRYIGLAKTHLQHLFTAAAINLSRLADWLAGEAQHIPIPERRAATRTSHLAALVPS